MTRAQRAEKCWSLDDSHSASAPRPTPEAAEHDGLVMPRLPPFYGTALKITVASIERRAAYVVRHKSCSSSHNDADADATAAKSKRTRAEHSKSPASVSWAPSRQSTVERGTIFENHTMAYLQHTFPRMTLMRSGGKNDGGVDLTGWWQHPLRLDEADVLPTSSNDDKRGLQRIRVTVQCKAEATKLGPRHIRELHGTMFGRFTANGEVDGKSDSAGGDDTTLTTPRPATPDAVPSMAVLASSAGFSPRCVLQAMTTPFPLLLLHLLHPQHDRHAPPATPPYPFVCPSIAANDALRNNLLRGRLNVRWLATLFQPPRTSPLGRPPSPVRIDMPFIFLNGKQR